MKADDVVKLEAGRIEQPSYLNRQGVPLLPDGEYRLSCLGSSDPYEWYDAWRIAVAFEVIAGPYAGALPIKRFYRLGPKGQMPKAWSNDLNIESALLLGAPGMDFSDLIGREVIGRLVTVRTLKDKTERPRPLWYSKAVKLWEPAQ